MARQARKISTTDFYHVIMRGNNKSYIFKLNAYKTYFLEQLRIIAKEDHVEIAAWCLMDNHVHLVVKITPEEMAIFFKRINRRFAMYHHRKEKSVGHVFENRYKSEVIESDASLLNVIRYVHNNPVKAKMVNEPSAYKWSSYNDYVKGSNEPVMSFVWSLFDSKRKLFEDFHQKDDYEEYLEIKEDREKLRVDRAQSAIRDVSNKYGITDGKEIYDREDILKEVVQLISTRSKLSGRKIGDLIGVSESTVRRMKK